MAVSTVPTTRIDVTPPLSPLSSNAQLRRSNHLRFSREFNARTRGGQKTMGPVSASLGGILGGMFKGTDTGESTRSKYSDKVAFINRLESEMSRLSDAELREKTEVFKDRVQNKGESLDSLLPVSQNWVFLLLHCSTFWFLNIICSTLLNETNN